jgi:soluble lytic murein transglycosylase-like protein
LFPFQLRIAYADNISEIIALTQSHINLIKQMERKEKGYKGKNVALNYGVSFLQKEMPYERAISIASQNHGVDDTLIRAIIKVESNYQPWAVSWAGAIGLMQLMPKTALKMGVYDPMSPSHNISGGTKYLKSLYEKFGSLKLAILAYNAGPGNIQKGNIPSGTKSYLKKVLYYYMKYKEKANSGQIKTRK